MKKFLPAALLLCALAPGIALASAYNDVSLTSSVHLTVNGIEVDVLGATLNQIAVDSGSFSVNLGPNSTIQVTAPNLNKLDLSQDVLTSSLQCNASGSNLTLTAPSTAATTTLTITPRTTICGATVGGGGGGNGPVISSGGGGGYTTPVMLPTTPSTGTTTGSSVTSQLQTQLNSLLGQIASLGGSPITFKHTLGVGSTGADVKALQVYLNTHGYAVAASGAGSSGHETMRFGPGTKAALIKFQKAVGISPASGLFGALTRAYVNSHP